MILILGAGLTGLSISYFLNKKGVSSTVLEKESYIGGLCSELSVGKFKFERVQHLIHLRDDIVRNFIEKNLNIPLNKYERSAKIWFRNRLVPYPFQANLYKLPLILRVECLITFVWSKFISSKGLPVNSSYKNWSNRIFGAGISKYFMIPYNEKMWNFSADKLTTEWIGRLMPTPSFKEIIWGAIRKNDKRFGYNSIFYYPQDGSISLIPKALNIGNVKTEHKVTSINLKRKRVITENRGIYNYDKLINTMPLPVFISLVEDCPLEIKTAANKLLHTGIHILNIVFSTNKFIKDFHWCYFPERKYKFYRLGVASNFSDKLVPAGYSSCYIEFNSDIFTNYTEDDVFNEVTKQLIEIGILKNKNDVTAKKLVYIPYAYVIYDTEYHQSMSTILTYLKSKKIISVGRFGAWEYSYIEKNIKDAMEVSNNLSK